MLSMKARKDVIQQEQPKEEEKIKDEEEKKPKLRDDSTFLDQVQDVKYEDFSDELIYKN